MILSKITLKEYRNIAELTMRPDAQINVIYGANAQGKTNLLEAIALFGTGRSFRNSRESELIRLGADKKKGARLEIDFSTIYDSYCAKLHLKEKKEAFLNDVPVKEMSRIGDLFPVMVFSPRDLALVQSGPEERRRFLDNGLCQLKSMYATLLKHYKTVLDQRSALLKQIRANMDWRMHLDIWDGTLAAMGAKIMYQRQQYLQRLTGYTLSFFEGLGGKKEQLSFKMEQTVGTGMQEQSELEALLLDGLLQSRERDIAAGYTTIGPHRDDLLFFLNGLPVKDFGSQGQQRSVALAAKMGEAYVMEEVYEEAPVILLDDVLSELDQRRQNYIMNHIARFQVFLTCCEKEAVFRLEQGKAFCMAGGALEETAL